MELKNKYAVSLLLAMAISPMLQVHAGDYYNNALRKADRTTRTTMKDAIALNKTVGAIVTSIKDQGQTGTCWAFAGVAAAEASLLNQLQNATRPLPNPELHFSERYAAWMVYALSKEEEAKGITRPYYLPNGKFSEGDLKVAPTEPKSRAAFSVLTQGGTISQELSLFTNGYLVEEKGDPNLVFYNQAADALKNKVEAVVTPSYKARDLYFTNDSSFNTKSSSNIGINSSSQLPTLQKYKDIIKQNGSFGAGYNTVGKVTNYNTGSIYKNEKVDPGHAILIVGYDDDYDFTKNSTSKTGDKAILAALPPGKGAWIMKNSWGSGEPGDPTGDAGFFYISYYDKSLQFSYATVMEPDTGRYTITDTHSPLPPSATIEAKGGIPTFASQYKAKDNQFIKAVTFLTNNDGASYKIEIINKSNNNPRAKAIYTQQGKFEGEKAMSGYHTVDLSKFVLVPKNDSYMIRVTVTAKSGLQERINFTLTDKDQTGVTYKNNESYYLYDGQWLDSKLQNAAVVLNGQSKETNAANGGDFTVGSLNDNKKSSVIINLGQQNELYNTDLINPTRKTLSNMTVDIDDSKRIDNFYGQITGEGQVIKTGTGALSLFGNNTYTGFTNVNQGTLNNYGSSDSNVSILSSAIYKVINEKANTSLSERGGIINKGNVYIIAADKSTINFTNKSDDPADPDYFVDDTGGKWYLNTTNKDDENATTNGKIAINVDTSKVTEKVWIKGGTISTTLTSLFTNAIKDISLRAKISTQGATPRTSSRMFSSKSSSSYLSEVNLGKMIIEDKTQIDIDTKMSETSLLSDLIKGSVIDNSGTEDNTPNKIKLGFILDEDVTFADITNGIFSAVANGQIAKVINSNAFAVIRGIATESYNIAYDTSNGVLTIKNADAPTTLQKAITENITSKYYSLDDNQSLSVAWTPTLVGNDLTLAGNGKTIDGNNTTQIFNIGADKMLSLKDTTVTNGTGGAIHNEGVLSIDATDSNSEFTQNQGTDGGAIYNKDTVVLTATSKDIKFQNNSADNGAGIYNDIDLSVPNKFSEVIASADGGNIEFKGNNATSSGGAIYNKGDVALFAENAQVNFNNNQAASGAGIYNNAGDVSLIAQSAQMNFDSNIASDKGGAIANESGNVDIISNDSAVNFLSNQASQGGAIYNNASGSANSTINVIAGNEATTENGADIVFAGNSATQGGAIYNTKAPGATGNAEVNLTTVGGNIIFNGNSATGNGGAIYNTQTVNIATLNDYNVSFKQSTDTVYNTGSVNLNYSKDCNSTNGSIYTGAEFGGTGTYYLYGGTLALVASTDKNASGNPNSYGSISQQSNLTVVNDATLDMANGRIDTFKPSTFKIENNSALLVAIDCIIKNNTPTADFLDAGTYTKEIGSTSQIIIETVNLVNSSDDKAHSYRVQIADDTLKSEISASIMSVILGYRSGYIARTGELVLLSTALPALMDFVGMTDAQRTYAMDSDESVILPVGTMQGENSTLTVNGNNHTIAAEYSYIEGVTVSETNTLKLNNVTFSGFETAVTNKGTLDLDNVTFNGVADPTLYDVKNLATANLNNTIVGKIYNSGTLTVGAVNNLAGVVLKTIDASVLDLRNSTNDLNFKEIDMAGKVNLFLNGTNKLSAQTVSHENITDSLVIKTLTKLSSPTTTITETDDLKSFITLADDVAFSLGTNARPVGDFNAYNLNYSSGIVSVNGADLSDNSEKSGSYNVEKSTNFIAGLSNTIASGRTVTLTSTNSNAEITLPNATTVSGILGLNNTTTSGGQITLSSADDSASLLINNSTIKNNLDLSGGNADVKGSLLSGAINLGDAGELTFSSGLNTVDGTITGLDGSSIVVNAATMFNNTVDPTIEYVNQLAVHNANASDVDFVLGSGGELRFSKDSYLNNHSNSLNFQGGTLNLMNGAATTINLNSLAFTSSTDNVTVSNMYVDVDLANKTMDKLQTTTTNIGNGSILNIAGVKLLSDAKEDNTSINFTTNDNLKAIVQTNVTNVAFSPIYQYLVGYNGTSGNFDFARSFNPSVLASPIAAQVGSYLTQINSYEQAFGNMDMMMSMTQEQRQAMKLANKYAAAGSGANLTTFSPNQIPEQDAGGWFRPYTTIENVGLNGGPTVRNVAFGSLFGGDTPIMELKNGWDAVFTGYAGYNGSHQTYDGVGIYQNGATVGATGVFYKGDFFTGVTANVGANAGEANTMFGKENFTLLATGIASKTGYNWELADGKFIIQPNLLMSYSFVNTFNYTNAAGVNISSNPLNAIQIAPGVRFIGNLKNGWQPYAAVQMVWNIMDQTRFSANDVSLPDLSIGPYIQYGIGLQRRWGERFTGYGQAMMFNGGRTGIAFQFGFRWALGKDPKKMTGGTRKTAELKKCNINLQSFKNDDKTAIK